MTPNLISVIDDDESVRRTTKLLIESSGYQVAAFESAESLLSSGRLEDTSCLIVDLHMPGMNGLQLQNHLLSVGNRIPIIFISAYGESDSRRQALQAGAVAFLTKPFTDTELFRTIHLALRDEKDPATT